MGIRVESKHKLPRINHIILMLECYRSRGRGRPRPREIRFDLSAPKGTRQQIAANVAALCSERDRTFLYAGWKPTYRVDAR